MTIPGFTAEASLYNGNVRYRATTEASFYGGIVQPAQIFSDVVMLYPWWCWEQVCIDKFHTHFCIWWNRCSGHVEKPPFYR